MSHYFINDTNVKSNRHTISFTFEDTKFQFISDNGVFSKGEIDSGSLVLIKYLVNQDLGKRILDLGCGYGTIGIILNHFLKDTHFTMVDINERALGLCQENCTLNHTNSLVKYSNGFENVEEIFDTIVTNPPIRAGKETIYKMFDDSVEHLKENGSIYVVIRKSHGANSAKKKLSDLYGNCEVVKKDLGFYILKSTKKVDK